MVQFYEFNLLLYNHHHGRILNISIISQKSSYASLKSDFPHFQAKATIDLLSMRLNNIPWKLFYENGKNGINSSDSAKYNL